MRDRRAIVVSRLMIDRSHACHSIGMLVGFVLLGVSLTVTSDRFIGANVVSCILSTLEVQCVVRSPIG